MLTHLLNKSNERINPATEEKQDSTILGITIVTVTAASQTLEELFVTAGKAVDARTRMISLRPLTDVNIAYGAAATVATTNIVDGDVWTETAFAKGTDLRFIAGGNVAMTVVEVG
jgi:hypothetical protein